jgi:hypothetical protein
VSKNTKTTTTGISLLGVLQIIFIVLKLCGLIDWSWWKVFIPMWIDLGIIAGFLLLYLVILIIAYIYDKLSW